MITKKPLAERVLAAVHSIDDLIFTLSSTGVFVDYFQDKLGKDLYMDPKRFINKHYKDVLPKHIGERFATALKKVEHHKAVDSFDYLFLRDGTEIWFEARINGIFEEGALVGYVVVVRDITKRKSAEEKLTDHVRSLEAIKQMYLEREREVSVLKEENQRLKKKSKRTR